MRYQYDADGKIIFIIDRNNNHIQFQYTGSTLSQVEFPSGQVLKLQYEEGKLSMITDIIGRKVHYHYEGELLTEVTYAYVDGSSEKTKYDGQQTVNT